MKEKIQVINTTSLIGYSWYIIDKEIKDTLPKYIQGRERVQLKNILPHVQAFLVENKDGTYSPISGFYIIPLADI